jgi:hypothetical protein
MTSSQIHRSTLRCMAPHPLRERFPEQFGRRTCNAHIINLPAPCRWTGKVTRDEADIPAGMIPARCPKCKHFSEYEVVNEGEAEEEGDLGAARAAA